MSNSQCPICCENFNASTRATITCANAECNFDACKSCVRTYLLNTAEDPHCMKCRHGWGQQFLVEKLNRSFMTKDYKEHRQKLLLEREISKMPETMDAADRHKRSQEHLEKADDISSQIKLLKEHINTLKEEEWRHRNRSHRILRGKDKTQEKRAFIMACPGEGCRGFLSTQYKCEICKIKTCPKCFEIMGPEGAAEEHTCLKENIQSAELIRKETKPCPSCGTRISKINGCDQMWCVNCHQAFSWNTGEIDNGTVHNPHFYQYERAANNGEAIRQAGDVLCGGLVGWGFFRNQVLQELSYLSGLCDSFTEKTMIFDIQKKVRSLHRFMTHITHVTIDSLRRKVRDLGNTEKTRIRYILKEISKEELSTEVYKIDTNRRKLTEMLHIYELINVVGIEMFTTFVNMPHGERHPRTNVVTPEGQRTYLMGLHQELEKFDNLLHYCNMQFADISITYNCSVAQIMKTGNIYSKKFKKHEVQSIQMWWEKKELFEKEYIEKNKTSIGMTRLNCAIDNVTPPNEELIGSVDECLYNISSIQGFHTLVEG